MALSPKLRRFDDEDIVKYGVDAPLVGVGRGRETRELRDMALILGTMVNLPKPAKAAPPAPATPDMAS